jgi:hypothetical protein
MDIEKEPAPATEAVPIKEEPATHTLLLGTSDFMQKLKILSLNLTRLSTIKRPELSLELPKTSENIEM